MIKPLLVALVAGMATGLGGMMSVFMRKPGQRFTAFVLGFSAGVMIHLSFVELLQNAVEVTGFVSAHLYFIIGMLIMFAMDLMIPHEYGTEDHHAGDKRHDFYRASVLVVLGIAIHNLPEGIAVFVGGVENINIGIALAVAVGMHNIPEGLAVATVVYAATNSRRQAILWSWVSGLVEPLGALIAAAVLYPIMSEYVLGATFALVAGIMVFIALDELLPSAVKCGTEHVSIIGVMSGIAVMATSLWLFDHIQ